jgi:hypothetical protein
MLFFREIINNEVNRMKRVLELTEIEWKVLEEVEIQIGSDARYSVERVFSGESDDFNDLSTSDAGKVIQIAENCGLKISARVSRR